MNNNHSSGMPIGFAMALAHNTKAMYAFLKLDDEKQDSIINKAKETKTMREMQQLVDNIVLS